MRMKKKKPTTSPFGDPRGMEEKKGRHQSAKEETASTPPAKEKKPTKRKDQVNTRGHSVPLRVEEGTSQEERERPKYNI